MKLRFTGPIQLPDPSRIQTVESAFQGGSVRDLLQELGLSQSQVASVSVLKDGQRLAPMAKVTAGDSLTISVLVGGG